MSDQEPRDATRWSGALLAVGLAAATAPLLAGNAFPLMLAAVTVAAWYGGPRLGLAATLAVLALAFYQPAPQASPSPDAPNSRHLINFAAVALLITGLAEASQAARRRAEEVARERHASEERYRLFFERNPHPMWVYDVQTLRFLAVNEAAIRRYGYSREEFLAMTIASIRPSEDVPALVRQVKETQDQAALNTTGWRHRTKDGTILDVEISSDALEFEGHRARLVLASDVTERHRAEQQRDRLLARERASRAEAEASERRYRMLARAIPQIVWAARPDGSADYFNPRWVEYTGLTKDRSLGQGWLETLHPEDGRRWGERWQRAAGSAEEFTLDLRLRAADGSYHWHLARALPMRDRDGRVVKWLGTFTDIEDQKRAEGAQWFLARASAELAASLDDEATLARVARLATRSIADLCVVDLAPEQGGPLRRVAAAHADADHEEHTRALRLRHPIDPSGTHPIARVFRTGCVELVDEVASATSDATQPAVFRELRVGSYVCAPLTARGRTLGVLTLAMAESGRRYGQADLRLVEELARRAALAVDNARLYRDAQNARAEAEAASGAKDQFLAMLSHELRTPLNPVLFGLSSLLEDPDTPPSVRPDLEMARRNVETEARLIDDLLDLTRISRDKLPLRLEVVNAHELIRQAVDVCREDLYGAGIELGLDLWAYGHHVEADPVRLQQVVWNLIKNATKFTPSGGAIIVTTHNGPASPGDTGWPSLVLEVRDTGIGIDPAVVGRIFEPFDQGDAPEARRRGGLGLGLAITRSIVEAHGGRISVTSPGRGHGSTFAVEMSTVPAPITLDAAGPSSRFGASGHRPLRILLVEDNKDTLRYLAWVLGQHGHSVVATDRLSSALEEAASADDLDLVISDVQLPDGSGLDLMRILRTGREVPGIALSGYGSDDDVELSLASGFAEHLTKPVDVRALVAAIEGVTAAVQ
jgi:PAS domain S-box-containing protein